MSGFMTMCTRACYVVPILSQINSSHFCHTVSSRYIVILSSHLQLLSFLLFLEQKLSVLFFYYKTIMRFFVDVTLCHRKGRRTQSEGMWEQDAKGNIWFKEGRSDRRIEKIIYGGGFWLFTSPSVVRIINSKQIQLAQRVACIREVTNC